MYRNVDCTKLEKNTHQSAKTQKQKATVLVWTHDLDLIHIPIRIMKLSKFLLRYTCWFSPHKCICTCKSVATDSNIHVSAGEMQL